MQVEIHELELRYAALRVLEPARQARLAVSLAREVCSAPCSSWPTKAIDTC